MWRRKISVAALVFLKKQQASDGRLPKILDEQLFICISTDT